MKIEPFSSAFQLIVVSRIFPPSIITFVSISTSVGGTANTENKKMGISSENFFAYRKVWQITRETNIFESDFWISKPESPRSRLCHFLTEYLQTLFSSASPWTFPISLFRIFKWKCQKVELLSTWSRLSLFQDYIFNYQNPVVTRIFPFQFVIYIYF